MLAKLSAKSIVMLACFLNVLPAQYLPCKLIEVTAILSIFTVYGIILHPFSPFPNCQAHIKRLQPPRGGLDVMMNCCNVTFALFVFSVASKNVISGWRLC